MLAHFVARYGRDAIEAIGQREIDAWVRSLSDKAEVTRSNYCKVARRFFEWCRDCQIISSNPMRQPVDERRPKRQELTVVYLIADEEAGLFKIGISTAVKNRTIALTNGSGRDLLLLKTWGCKNHSRLIERALHRKFEDCRIRGEWFRLPSDAVQALVAIDSLDALASFAGIISIYGSASQMPAGTQ